MSRDPYDNYQSDDPDRHERERPPGDDSRGSRAAEAARRKVALPALLLILNALLGFVFAGVASVPLIFEPERIVRFMRDIAAQQPPGPQRQDLEQQADQMDTHIQQNRLAIQIENVIKLGVLVVANGLVLLGAVFMRGLGSYGLSLTAAIVSLIPGATGISCCCTGMPLGLWALLVLLNPVVKDGFAARRAGGPAPDRY